MKSLFLTFITTLVLVTGVPSFVYAQEVSAKIELSPESPEPRSSVTLTLTSYTFNMDTALISWKVNGVVTLTGVGENRLTLKTGDVGESQEVIVAASNQAGYSVEQKITVTPASVVLLQEAPNSHVPSFYEGRSFAATAGLTRVTALPSIGERGTPLDPSVLSYTWYVNDDVVRSASGKGKQSVDVRLDYLRTSTNVRVIVRTPLGSSVTKTITLRPFEIKPLLYRFDEVLGSLLNSPVSERLETTKVTPLKLEPYFVSSKDQKPSSYRWLLNGFDITPLGGQVLALVPKENSYGVSDLKITISGPDKRLQSAEKHLEIVFDTRK